MATLMQSTSGPFGQPAEEQAPPRELEVIAADMETRLRGTILRILRPALDQMGDMLERLKGLTSQVGRHEEVIIEAEKQKEVISQQAEFIKIVSDRVDDLDMHARKLERNVSADIGELRAAGEELEKRLESHQNELRKQGRDMARAWDEMGRLQEQHDDANHKIWDGIGQGGKKIDGVRDECMELIRELQVQREEMWEELWGEGKGLTQLARDIGALSTFVQPIPDLGKQQRFLAEQAEKLSKTQDDVMEYCANNQREMDVFCQNTATKLAQMKEEFKHDANRLVAHHASIMKDIRRDYSDEIHTTRSMREEITRFQRNAEEFCQEMAERVKSESRRIDAIHREMVQDLEEVSKRRKKDRGVFESEMQETRRQVTLERAISQEVRVNVEYLSRIIGLVLEGERLSNALLVQDFSDRAGEKWLSLPSELGRRPQAPTLPDGLDQLRRGEGWARHANNELVPIDWRKGLVRSEYLPGQVPFQGVVYDRKDLLMLHHKLLQKAHAAFVRGPPEKEEPAASIASAGMSGQPGANGGAAAGAHPVPKREAGAVATIEASAKDDEDRKLSPADLAARRSAGARQRPGSQGQPQAMGSRGTMSGPLGETGPPPLPDGPGGRPSNGAPLRLPAIGGAGGGEAKALTAR